MIRTLIVDDSRSVRNSVRTLLASTDDIEVVGEASNGTDGVKLARELVPDVVLMDLRMPGGDGLDAIEALCGIGVEYPVPVIAFTSYHLDEYVYGAMERGAIGFLLKKNPGNIPAAIRAAVNAGALQSPAIRERLLADYARGGTRARRARTQEERERPVEQSLLELLSDREVEIIADIVSGYSNADIAANLSISINTVKWHVGNMLDKTGSANRTQLARWAASHGLNPADS